jgi:hypothetical protein
MLVLVLIPLLKPIILLNTSPYPLTICVCAWPLFLESDLRNCDPLIETMPPCSILTFQYLKHRLTILFLGCGHQYRHDDSSNDYERRSLILVRLVTDKGDNHAVEVEEEHEQVETQLDEGFLLDLSVDCRYPDRSSLSSPLS